MNSSNQARPNPEDWDIKLEERTKRRMKFRLKLNQEEADAFRNFTNQVKPDNISVDDFVKQIFFTGIRTLEEQLTNNMVQHIEANREEFEASGFSFDEEGKLTGVAEGEEGTTEVVE